MNQRVGSVKSQNMSEGLTLCDWLPANVIPQVKHYSAVFPTNQAGISEFHQLSRKIWNFGKTGQRNIEKQQKSQVKVKTMISAWSFSNTPGWPFTRGTSRQHPSTTWGARWRRWKCSSSYSGGHLWPSIDCQDWFGLEFVPSLSLAQLPMNMWAWSTSPSSSTSGISASCTSPCNLPS